MIDIEEVKFLYKKAQGNYLYFGDEDRFLEAFLIQSCILEGVLKGIALKEIESNSEISNLIFDKKKKFYNLNNLVDDLLLMKLINKKEYKVLDKYRKNRNNIIHSLLEKNQKQLNGKLKKIYEDMGSVLWDFINKLEDV